MGLLFMNYSAMLLCIYIAPAK